MPATEAVDFEREFAELVRELRGVPTEVPDKLRDRVRALGEPESRRPLRFPRLTRRTVLVLVSACITAVVATAVVRGVVVSSNSHHKVLETARFSRTTHTAVGGAAAGKSADHGSYAQVLAPTDRAVPAPNRSRYQDYQASLRVRVKDFDSLGRNSAKAIQITQSFGGFVASVEQ